jgi:RNA polymerase-associated protein RTF1
VRDLELQEQQKLESAKQRSQRAPSSAVEKKRKTLGKLKTLREKRHKKAAEDSEEGSYDSDEDAYEDGEVLDVNGESDEDSEESEYEASDEEVYPKKSGRKQKEEIPVTSKKITAPAEPITFEMANKIRLSRDLIAKWIYHPDFDDLARNSLMRLAIGNGPDGQQVYRLVEVKKIVPYYRAYKIGGASGATSINKAAILRYGKSERTFRLDVVSNSDFTPREFERWMSVLMEEKQTVPSLRSTTTKSEAWATFKDQPVSDEIIQAMLKAKKDLGQGHRNLVAEKTMLMHQREEAEASGNLEELEQIDLELADLAKEIEESQSKKSVSSRRLEALAEINKRNRQANISIAREAERLSTSNQKSDSKDSKHDPFSRRRCQPSNDVFGEEDANKTPVVEPVKPHPENVQEDPTPHPVTPVPQSQSQPQVLDLFAAHNVDIDIDI